MAHFSDDICTDGAVEPEAMPFLSIELHLKQAGGASIIHPIECDLKGNVGSIKKDIEILIGAQGKTQHWQTLRQQHQNPPTYMEDEKPLEEYALTSHIEGKTAFKIFVELEKGNA